MLKSRQCRTCVCLESLCGSYYCSLDYPDPEISADGTCSEYDKRPQLVRVAREPPKAPEKEKRV